MTISLIAAAPKMVSGIWSVAKPLLARSYAQSDIEMPDDLVSRLESDTGKVLWLVVEDGVVIGAVLTQLYRMASGKMLKVEHLGGDGMMKWWHLRSKIEEYAKAEGCDRVMCEGRIAFTRLLPDYEPIAVVLEKRL